MKKANLEKIIHLRHQLHMYPELSMQEKRTSKTLQRFLRENTSLKVVDCGGWFYAVKTGTSADALGNGTCPTEEIPAEERHPTTKEMPLDNSNRTQKKTAFRADMDALPIPEGDILPYHSRNRGISHKCGHDGHCAALCGLALEIDQRELENTVYLIFQPGEETGQGALLCRELVRKEEISEIFAFHNLGGFPENSVIFREGLTQPASEGLQMRFSGKTSHASEPEKGINPAAVIAKTALFAGNLTSPVTDDMTGEMADDITGDMASGISDGKSENMTSEIADRMTNGMTLCTVTGISLGNTDFGISPGEGELCVTLRAEHESDMKRIEAAILDYAQKLCDPAGIRFSFQIHDFFPETRNNGSSLRRLLKSAQRANLRTVRMNRLWRASEDFGWYLKECPGAMVYIGNGEDYPALHTAEYDFNDSILETAVDLFVKLTENT